MKITIEELQAYLYDHYGETGREQSLFMKLVEEMGEAAEILNMRAGRKASDGSGLTEELAGELADIIHYAVAIAAINKIDMNEAIIQKDMRASLKYGHRTNLVSFAEEMRQTKREDK